MKEDELLTDVLDYKVMQIVHTDSTCRREERKNVFVTS